MFCSECGKKASGRFCWNCGTKLQTAESSATPQRTTNAENRAVPSAPAVDWSNEINYDVLIHIQEIKDLLALQVPKTRKMSAQEFISMFPKPMQFGSNIGLSLGTSMGLKVRKEQVETVPLPCGKVLVSFLVYIAGSGMPITAVQQASDAVVFICEIPSGVNNWQGQLVVKILRAGAAATKVDATATIPGQMYDWGKSKKILQAIFAAVNSEQKISTPSSAQGSSSGSNQAVAKFDFTAEQTGDLGFKKGDVIKIITKTDSQTDWWTGQIGDRVGNFPSNYVSLK